jgi:hypothetical protein
MLNPLIAASSLLLFLAAPAVPDWETAVALMKQRQQVTIHVPRVTVTSSTTIILRARPAPRLVEKKAADCVEAKRIAGFTVNTSDSVDLLLNDGSLLRAKLGADCPALGFYSGFYVKAAGDKKICANRDAFRSRSGRSCAVQAFKMLSPAR